MKYVCVESTLKGKLTQASASVDGSHSFFVFVFAFLAFLFIIYSVFTRGINLHVNRREFATQNCKSSNNRKCEQVNIQRAATVSLYNEFLKASLATTERSCVSASTAL